MQPVRQNVILELSHAGQGALTDQRGGVEVGHQSHALEKQNLGAKLGVVSGQVPLESNISSPEIFPDS